MTRGQVRPSRSNSHSKLLVGVLRACCVKRRQVMLHGRRGLLREHGLLRVSQPDSAAILASKPTIVRALVVVVVVAVEDWIVGLLLLLLLATIVVGLAAGCCYLWEATTRAWSSVHEMRSCLAWSAAAEEWIGRGAAIRAIWTLLGTTDLLVEVIAHELITSRGGSSSSGSAELMIEKWLVLWVR